VRKHTKHLFHALIVPHTNAKKVYHKDRGEKEVKYTMKFWKQAMKYFSKYPDQNAFVHLLGGIGIGFLLTYPVASTHPVRWGALFILLAVIGFTWAGSQKTK
jgi:hypothetical protein